MNKSWKKEPTQGVNDPSLRRIRPHHKEGFSLREERISKFRAIARQSQRKREREVAAVAAKPFPSSTSSLSSLLQGTDHEIYEEGHCIDDVRSGTRHRPTYRQVVCSLLPRHNTGKRWAAISARICERPVSVASRGSSARSCTAAQSRLLSRQQIEVGRR